MLKLICLNVGANGSGQATAIAVEETANNAVRSSTYALCLLNAGDSLQRYCMDNNVKLSKLSCVAFTSLSPHNTSGLPGLILALSSLGVASITLLGPPGLQSYVHSIQQFVKRRYPEVRVVEVNAQGDTPSMPPIAVDIALPFDVRSALLRQLSLTNRGDVNLTLRAMPFAMHGRGGNCTTSVGAVYSVVQSASTNGGTQQLSSRRVLLGCLPLAFNTPSATDGMRFTTAAEGLDWIASTAGGGGRDTRDGQGEGARLSCSSPSDPHAVAINTLLLVPLEAVSSSNSPSQSRAWVNATKEVAAWGRGAAVGGSAPRVQTLVLCDLCLRPDIVEYRTAQANNLLYHYLCTPRASARSATATAMQGRVAANFPSPLPALAPALALDDESHEAAASSSELVGDDNCTSSPNYARAALCSMEQHVPGVNGEDEDGATSKSMMCYRAVPGLCVSFLLEKNSSSECNVLHVGSSGGSSSSGLGSGSGSGSDGGRCGGDSSDEVVSCGVEWLRPEDKIIRDFRAKRIIHEELLELQRNSTTSTARTCPESASASAPSSVAPTPSPGCATASNSTGTSNQTGDCPDSLVFSHGSNSNSNNSGANNAAAMRMKSLLLKRKLGGTTPPAVPPPPPPPPPFHPLSQFQFQTPQTNGNFPGIQFQQPFPGAGRNTQHAPPPPPPPPPPPRPPPQAASLQNESRFAPPKPRVLVSCLGTGSATPSKHRSNTSILLKCMEPSVLGSVQKLKNVILLDTGEGVSVQLFYHCSGDIVLYNELLVHIGLIWISHHHADHLTGIPMLLEQIRRARLQSQSGIGRKILIVGSVTVLKFVQSAATCCGLDDLIECMPISMTESRGNGNPLCDQRVSQATGNCVRRLVSIPVFHCPMAYAVAVYFEGGFKLVFSGDCRPAVGQDENTQLQNSALENQTSLVQKAPESGKFGRNFMLNARNCNLLIHEATFDSTMLDDAVAKKHSTVSEAALVGRRIGAAATLLTHFSQRYPRVMGVTNRNSSSNSDTAAGSDNSESGSAKSEPIHGSDDLDGVIFAYDLMNIQSAAEFDCKADANHIGSFVAKLTSSVLNIMDKLVMIEQMKSGASGSNSTSEKVPVGAATSVDRIVFGDEDSEEETFEVLT